MDYEKRKDILSIKDMRLLKRELYETINDYMCDVAY